MNSPASQNGLSDTTGAGRRYRGASNEERRSQRRERFLAAGLTCFARDGYHQTTVRGLCASAALTERYFYESFGSTEDLFREVYLMVSGDVRLQILTAVSVFDSEDLEHFSRTALRAFFESIQRNPDYVPVLFQEALSVSREMTQLALATLNEFVDLLMQIGQPSFLRQTAVRVEPGLMSAALVGGIMHMAARWAAGGFRTPIQDVVENAMLIFAGLQQV